MEIGTVLSVAGTLFSALQNPMLHEVLSMSVYKNRLNELQGTVDTIKAVLRDAETKQGLSHQDQDLIEKLKDTVFEADDLFDEFVTLAQLKQLRKADGRLSEKVSTFFSRSENPLSLAYRMSRGVKDIKKKLDAIAYDTKFSFKIDPEPTKKRRRETCSYVKEDDIIGRQDDFDSIVGTLLDSDVQGDVSVLSIVGIGGLGKTALAQLVYKDPRVKDAFPLRLWTCVSDEDQKELDVMNILAKILGRSQDGSTMEQLQTQLRARLAGNKYLLVLDDVWAEKRDQWCDLARYLIGDKRGSWIVVTTRSQKTAEITGGLMHQLSGLSKENSWHLFERVAFGSDQQNPPDELVMIGKRIVDGCCGVPLAIRVTGSLLYCQDKSKWQSVLKIGLANIRAEGNGIMNILKLSFDHLETPLKNCFRYCALFPKDYVMQKEMLINLWMAQGYIVPLDKSQSIEDAGEEYFSILTRRCFFQDIKKDDFGEVMSCKMHDLMHDLAQNVAGKEICALDSISGDLDKNVRHLSNFNISEYEDFHYLGKTHIRSLLFSRCKGNVQLAMGASILGKFKCLRVLDLSNNEFKHLPDSIGELLHLRYVDLSECREMEALPNSITKLCNLQTLILHGCTKFKKLPKDLSKLANLKVLDISDCYRLECIPRGMGKLTRLHTMKGRYTVGGKGSYTSWEEWFDELQDLKKLINLKGHLGISIWWPDNAKNDVNKEDWKEESCLSSKEHLSSIALYFRSREKGGRTDDEGIKVKLMENLRPHSNLESLAVWVYHGEKMPGWVSLLPNLVSLKLSDCKELKYLSSLEKLCNLKYLYLVTLSKLEYIEEEEMVSFFPVLAELELIDLPKFKGWRRGAGAGASMEESSNNNRPHLLQSSCLPQLKTLTILKCPELACIVVCPKVETLILTESNRKCQMVWGTKAEEILSENSSCKGIPNLMRKMNNASNKEEEAAWLNWKPMESFHTLRTLTIEKDDELMELPSWMQYLSALQSLTIINCKNLTAMPSWMPKLTSLKELKFLFCSESLKKRCQKDPPGEDWPFIQHIPIIRL